MHFVSEQISILFIAIIFCVMSGSVYKYVKHPNLICVETVSSKDTFRSLGEAKSNCSKSENCSAIQISEFYGNKKIELCKITEKKKDVGNSCVHKKVKIDCTEPPQSMNGDTLHKGCAGAAYINGNPARKYCENDEGKYPWWQMCCYWNNKTCLPKENALEASATITATSTITTRTTTNKSTTSPVLENKYANPPIGQKGERNTSQSSNGDIDKQSTVELTSTTNNYSSTPDTSESDGSERAITIVLFVIIIFLIAAIIFYLAYSKSKIWSQKAQTNHECSGISLISEYPGKYSCIETSDSGYAENSRNVGNRPKLSPSQDMKRRARLLPYDTKREISRAAFTITDQIGGGNFGDVSKGEIKGLYGENTKTAVAIKSINGPAEGVELRDFLEEIKIMSYIKPHINLVSMIGSCYSDTQYEREMYLLIEFCHHGDLRTYLIDNKIDILTAKQESTINDRCLLYWSFEIAKGMEYLAKNNIMHGDLAARNVLLDESLIQGSHPVAKITDFGLSKKIYDDTNYMKEARLYVPWKWMALEYLRNDYFTLTSDVWSFGIVLWEILSFSRVPYGHDEYDEVLLKLEDGYRLPCPDDIKNISNWSAERYYGDVTKECFVENPKKRAQFSKVVEIIKSYLSEEELSIFYKLEHKYESERSAKYMKIGLS